MMDNKLIAEMTDQIVLQFSPVQVILFGSQARGNPTPDSDVDLLVVLPQGTDKRQSAIAIRRALSSFKMPKDILVTTPEEIKSRGKLNGSFLQSALLDGKVIYERR